MSMFYVPPKSKRRKRPTKKQQALLEAHNAELKRLGLSSDTSLVARRVEKETRRPTMKARPVHPRMETGSLRHIPSHGGTVDRDSTARRSIMDRLHLEDEKTREAIVRKSKSIAPHYSKGAYQYVSDIDIVQDLGRKK